MKALIAYYSRTGNTKKVAKEIKKYLKSNIEEIFDKEDRSGIKGWMSGGRDATQKNIAEIKFKKSPSKYDLVIVGTPIWGFTVTPAIRSYLKQNKFKKLAFFSTSAGVGIKRTFKEMEKISKKPIATLALKSKAWSVKLHLDKDNNKKKIKNFCYTFLKHNQKKVH